MCQLRLPFLTPLVLHRNCNLPSIAAFGTDCDLARGALFDALELVAPLNEYQRIRSEQLIEPQGFKLALRLQPIHVDMEQFDRLAIMRTVILVDQRECGAGDLVWLGGIE